MSRYASMNAAAEYLDMHPRTIRRMVARGQLTGYRIGDRMIRVDLDEIDELIKGGALCDARP